MDEWLKLTEEDIARAHRLTRDHPLMNDIIIISPEESEDISQPHPRPASRNARIRRERDTGNVAELEQSTIPVEAIRQPILTDPLRITIEDLTPSLPQLQTTPRLEELEKLMFRLINAERAERLPGFVGTAALAWQEKLAAVARGHSEDMLRRQYIAHLSPEGVTAASRIDRVGIRYLACGENIGVVYGEASHGEPGVREIHRAFMDQPRSLTNHRGNILNPIWTHAGIGISHKEDGALVATQVFISAPTARLRGK